MVDLVSVFYVLGILFFFTFFVFLMAIFVFVLTVRNKVNTLPTKMPEQIIAYLRGNNSAQLKALGVALVGILISFLRGRMGKKKSA